MTKKALIGDTEKILNQLHDQVFGTEGKVEQFEKFQELGLDVDSICIAQHNLYELKKIIND